MGKKSELPTNNMASAFQNSMLTGIPQIISAGNLPKKIVRALVFVFCVAGFVYQSVTFMELYYQYKTVIDIQYVNPTEVTRPSVTVCNANGISVDRACREHAVELLAYGVECSNYVDMYDGDLCKCRPRYCWNGVVIPGRREAMNPRLWNYISYEQRRKYMIKKEEFVVECKEMKMTVKQLEENCSDPYYKQLGVYQTRDLAEGCITMNTLINRPHHKLGKVAPYGEMFLKVDHNGVEYPDGDSDTTVVISVHSPYGIADPFVQGNRMAAGMLYQFHLKRVIKHLLPYPYETDCIDYMERWKSRGGFGPTNLRECLTECRVNISMERYGCLIEGTQGIGNYPRCAKFFSGMHEYTFLTDATECAKKNCRAPCYEEYYTSYREVSPLDESVNCDKVYDYAHEKSGAHIMFDGMETMIYTYSPKFQNIETFSYVGGYVGMWLGISLLAVFDFLETVILMARYPIKRYRDSQAKKTKVSHFNKAEDRRI